MSFWSVDSKGNGVVVRFFDRWELSQLQEIRTAGKARTQGAGAVTLDFTELRALDTAGAMELLNVIGWPQLPEKIEVQGGDPRFQSILKIVRERLSADEKVGVHVSHSFLAQLGEVTVNLGKGIAALVNFLGQSVMGFLSVLSRPRSFRIKEFFVQLQTTCVDAVPICSLVTFLIGIVIAYLYASQMQQFGANIFIVEAVSIAMCRELSPLIVAIIVAGRSGSAYTAQIGTMKLNEEIDAIYTMGLSPMQVLVLPRVLALIISMPLLVFVGDFVGTLGGAAIADLFLEITPQTFIERLHTVFKLKHMVIGLIKAPVFAAFIGVIGCRMGLSVENNARSVGLNTTSTVVQSVVAVILLNAVFAVVCNELGY